MQVSVTIMGGRAHIYIYIYKIVQRHAQGHANAVVNAEAKAKADAEAKAYRGKEDVWQLNKRATSPTRRTVLWHSVGHLETKIPDALPPPGCTWAGLAGAG